jgi:hypothetical protein
MFGSAEGAGFTKNPSEPAVVSYILTLGSFLASFAASVGIG